MTTIKILISSAALCVASAAFAQSSSTCSWFPKGEDGSGVIGKRYVEAGLLFQDIRHTSTNAYGTGVAANIPVVKGLDLTGSYSYSWFNPNELKQHTHAVNAEAKFYSTTDSDIKPYVAADLGLSSLRETGPYGWSYDNDAATWGFEVGAEFSYKWVSITPRISYSDDFNRARKSEQSWNYGVEASSWVTSKVGASIGVTYVDLSHTSDYTWVYSVSIRFRF